MKRLAAALAVLFSLASCERAAAPVTRTTPARAPQPPVAMENGNLLNLVFGAAVIERNDELSYESAVAHALDGTAMTAWRSAPGGRLSGTFSLGAPTRLRRLGVTVAADAPEAMRVEASLDGKNWQHLLETAISQDVRALQFFAVAADALYLRFTFIEPKDYYKAVHSLHAIGSELAPAVQQPLEGCWEINHTMPARFERRGASVTGTIGDEMIVDGGADGRVYRLMWRERMNWGYAAVTVSADGNHLSGVRWHEEVNPKYSGDAWLGRRVPCTGSSSIDGGNVVDRIIARAGLWRLYGVRFDRGSRVLERESDDALDLAAKIIRDHPRHRFRLVAREFRETTEEKNVARADLILAAAREALATRDADLSRVAFANAGTERHPLAVDFTTQRVMDSCVELQVLPSQ